jgi:thiamine-monophosphate kinase
MGSKPDSSKRLGEFALIAKLFAPLAAKAPGAFGLTDDAATLSVPAGRELVVTVDALVEGVHFLRDDPADSIAKKALRVNLSDLAAKGATPEAYLLALSLPDWVDDRWLTLFAAGLGQDQELFGVHLLGGDTTAIPGPLTLSITAFGTVEVGRMIRRAGAQPGDLVFVTGTIGDAGAGLTVLKGEGAALSASDREALVARYRLPEPRVAFGPRLVGLASAALDVSDGLIADIGHIAEVSKVRVVVDAARVPMSESARALWGNGSTAILRVATSGDDYEIAFTAPPSARAGILKAAAQSGLAVHEIGRVEPGTGVLLLDERGQPIPMNRAGFTHF